MKAICCLAAWALQGCSGPAAQPPVVNFSSAALQSTATTSETPPTSPAGTTTRPPRSTTRMATLTSTTSSATDTRAKSVAKFLDIYTAKEEEFELLNPPHPRTYLGLPDPDCPVPQFEVDGRPVRIDRTVRLARQGDSDVYRTTDGSAVVKVITSRNEVIPSVWKDEAALWTLATLGVAPRVLAPVYPTGIARECALRTVTMEYAGDSNLMRQFDESPNPFSPDVVRRIGVRLITLLEGVHSVGLVHGDVHGGNVVGTNPESMKLIDFGRARPYINPEAGKHVTLTRMADTLEWNTIYLSINELEGWTVSRRDDLFRAAELLVFLCQDDADLYMHGVKRHVPPRREVIRRKRMRSFSAAVPKGIVDLYFLAMNMEFDATPDYRAIRKMIASKSPS